MPGSRSRANYALARRAERRNPPDGKFIQIDRVRLHYIDRGKGPAVILLHGNGMMARDFELSGLIDLLARHHRVIAFDRPGFGYSERPRNRIWTAEAQAILLWRALSEIAVHRPVIVGHSWGALVAVALALRYPAETAGLGLLFGLLLPERPARRGDDALAGSSGPGAISCVTRSHPSRSSNGSGALPHHVRAGTGVGSVQARLSG